MKQIYCVHMYSNEMSDGWPMKPALISGFCSVKRMRVFDTFPLFAFAKRTVLGGASLTLCW